MVELLERSLLGSGEVAESTSNVTGAEDCVLQRMEEVLLARYQHFLRETSRRLREILTTACVPPPPTGYRSIETLSNIWLSSFADPKRKLRGERAAADLFERLELEMRRSSALADLEFRLLLEFLWCSMDLLGSHPTSRDVEEWRRVIKELVRLKST